jgi:hypothetical protein
MSQPSLPQKNREDRKFEGDQSLQMVAGALHFNREDWRIRADISTYGHLTVVVPAVVDLLIPKLKRGEPRDKKHIQSAKQLQLDQTA